ncbi:hypothetical protein DKP78_23920, partial [Enterococcus faecium]
MAAVAPRTVGTVPRAAAAAAMPVPGGRRAGGDRQPRPGDRPRAGDARARPAGRRRRVRGVAAAGRRAGAGGDARRGPRIRN